MEVMAEDKIVMKKVSEIKPYVRNPRENQKTVDLLCELIPKVGFNVPLVIDQNGIIVKGHARFSAAIKLGMEEVPCIVTHASDEAVKIDRITDNKIAEYSKWVNEELEQEISEINLSGFNFDDLGLSRDEIEDKLSEPVKAEYEAENGLKNDFSGGLSDEKPQKEPEKYFKCVCDGCGHVMFVKASQLRRG